MPFFSVVIPVYNVEKYLEECLESILRQTFQDFEVILVDDGSTDSSPAICEMYRLKDSRVKVVHKKNGGLVSARKAGVENCTGEYVFNVDSDDYIAKELFEEVFKAIERTSPDIVAFDHTVVSENRVTLSNYVNPLDAGFYNKQAVKELKGKLLYDWDSPNHNYGCLAFSVWSKAFKRTLLMPNQLRVPNHIRYGEDLAVTIPCVCNAETLYVLRFAGYFYRQRELSITHTFDPTETERIRTLVNYISQNFSEIPRKCVDAYTVTILLEQLIMAARSLENFKEFKTYITNHCERMLCSALKNFEHKKLNVGSKARLWCIKHKLWYVFWAVYHKNVL